MAALRSVISFTSPSALKSSEQRLVKKAKKSQKLRSDRATVAKASSEEAEQSKLVFPRRDVLISTTLAVAATSLPCSPAGAVTKPPKGFSVHTDQVDNYAFYYPFGWEEVVVKGQDVTFKDVIEPLESVGVNIIKTDKTDLTELGSPDLVARTLVEKVLSVPSQPVKLVSASERDVDGRKYYSFEFLAQAPNYVRRGLGTVAIGYGKFYTCITGANERRYGKVEEKLKAIVDSFQLL